MTFYDLPQRISEYKFQINEATGLIVSRLSFNTTISIAARFLVYQLNITKDIDPYSCP